MQFIQKSFITSNLENAKHIGVISIAFFSHIVYAKTRQYCENIVHSLQVCIA